MTPDQQTESLTPPPATGDPQAQAEKFDPLTRFDKIRRRVTAATPGPYSMWIWGGGDLCLKEGDTQCPSLADWELLDHSQSDMTYLIACVDQASEDRRILHWEREQYKCQAEQRREWLDEAQTKLDTLRALLSEPPRCNPAEFHAMLREVIG